MFPSLNLFLSYGRTQSWRHAVENSSNGHVIFKKGVNIVEGWRISWRNGVASAGPVNDVFDIDEKGERKVFGRKARTARAYMRQRSSDYTRNGRGALSRFLLEILSLPFKLIAFIITLFTLPIYILVYVLWVIIALFWVMVMGAVALSARLFFRTRS